MSLKKFTLSLATVASLSLLAACSSTTQPAPSSQASTSSEGSTSQVSETSASSSTTSSKADTATKIDGTYKGQDEGDSITLVVTGNTGTWTEVEANGDQEVKKVTFEQKVRESLLEMISRFMWQKRTRLLSMTWIVKSLIVSFSKNRQLL